MRTNIVIDDDLMKEAMAFRQLKTKRALVGTGLKSHLVPSKHFFARRPFFLDLQFFLHDKFLCKS
jgi:Arc/MetJ family transcription regulator